MGGLVDVTGALGGMRVVERCQTVPAAFCGKLLSDLGADVVKVEPPEGDPSRRAGPFRNETSGRFLYLNTGKRSIVADDVTGLLQTADVLIDDVVDGDVPALPGLIWCSVTPFGQTGPYRHFKAEHLNIAHIGGEGHVLPGGIGWQMFPDRPPVQIGGHAAYLDAGTNAAIAVLGAYNAKLESGAGSRIDVSAFESQLGLFRTRLMRFTHDGVVVHQRANPYTSAAGMFLCRDGYVQILGPRDESWTALAGLDDRFADDRFATLASRTEFVDELNDIIASWCAEHTKAEVVGALGPMGFAVGAYAVPRDLLESPQLQHRRFFQVVDHPRAGEVVLPGVPYQLSATPVRLKASPLLGSGKAEWKGPAATPGPTGAALAPLQGVRVLDFTWAIAGPYTTMLLAFLGAEVIKVESSSRLDVARRGFSGKDYGGIDRSPDFHTLNLHKRSLGLDLTSPGGRSVIDLLLPLCDVVVDNFRPGVMARLSLGGEQLCKRFPSLVVASSSGNGGTGPEALYAGLASIFAAVGGMSEQTGYPDAPPTLIGESPDFRSGNLLAVAILAALAHRRRTGEGQFIDFSSREAMTCLSPDAFLAHTLGAKEITRAGNRDPVMAPHGVYRCQDQWLSIAVSNDEEWQSLCAVIGRADLATLQDRKAAEEVVDEAVGAWCGDRQAYDAFLTLQQAGVAAAPSFTNADLVADPHLRERGAFVEPDHPALGAKPVPGAPWQMMPLEIRPAPLLGQDNDYVLRDLLGLTDAEIADLGDSFS